MKERFLQAISFLLLVLTPVGLAQAATVLLSKVPSFVGDTGAAQLNYSFSGDFNGDGKKELGMCRYDLSTDLGSVGLFEGPFTGNESFSTADITINSDFIRDYFGENSLGYRSESCANAGDVNGDGYDDLLVGARWDQENGSSAGAVYLILGESGLSNGVVSDFNFVKFMGEDKQDGLGVMLSSAGDVNGDGYDDMVFGVSAHNLTQGAAYLVYGCSNMKYFCGTASSASVSLSDPLIVKLEGEAAADLAGGSVSAAGDFNGDGYDDFLVSAPYHDRGSSSTGAVYLVLGSASKLSSMSLGDSSIVKYDGETSTTDGELGFLATSAGDTNDDGYDDILLGAPYFSEGGEVNNGVVYLVLGSGSPTSSVVDAASALKVLGTTDWGVLGAYSHSASGIGDVNGDGYDDFMIGQAEEGSAQLFFGRKAFPSTSYIEIFTSGLGPIFTESTAGGSVGSFVQSIGDMNNDGYDDFAISGNENDYGAFNGGKIWMISGSRGIRASNTYILP